MAGVATANPFDFLGEDGDDSGLDQPVLAKESKRPLTKAAIVPKSDGPPVAATIPQPSGVEARMRGMAPERGRGRGGRGRAGRGREGGGDGVFIEAPQNGFPEGEGGGRGRGRSGRGRGRGGGRGEDHRRTQFDRYDVSGRSHETEKRHGAGKGNWGNEEDDIENAGEAPAAINAPTREPEAAAGAAPAGGGGDWDAAAGEEEAETEASKPAEAAAEDVEPASAVVEPEEPVVPEKPQMTLDEWEAMQKDKRGAAKPYKAMVVNKEDFSDMVAFTRKDRTADDAVLKLSNQKTKAAQKERERKGKEILETGFRISNDEGGRGRGRGGRGGRGGDRPEGGFRGNDGYPGDRPRDSYSSRDTDRPPFRGGRGREGGGRGREGGRGRGAGAAPQINDEAAFPGLG